MRLKHLLGGIIFLSLIYSCDNKSTSESQLKVRKLDTLVLDNTIVNFSVKYFRQGEEIKDPLPIDTLVMRVSYNESLRKIITKNRVELIPNVEGCNILRKDDDEFIIWFSEGFNSSVFIASFYLYPEKDIIYSIGDKKYYKRPQRIFIAEKQNSFKGS